MNTTNMEWAENEVRLACLREREGQTEEERKEWDYGCAILENALAAYRAATEAMEGQGHSGFSHEMTVNALERLLDGNVLTPITEDPEEWGPEENSVWERSKRKRGLRRRQRMDGTYEYTDFSRAYGFSPDRPSVTYGGGGTTELADSYFPIQMPYTPPERGYGFCIQEDVIPETGAALRWVQYVITPKGEKVEVNRFYADGPRQLIEIDRETWEYRRQKAEEQREMLIACSVETPTDRTMEATTTCAPEAEGE